MGLPYTYRVNELIKFTKNLKKCIYVLSILLHLCIKFQHQISNNEDAVKKIKILTDLQSEISFLLQINYNEFNLKILYTDRIV
jgi:hypothetical protein